VPTRERFNEEVESVIQENTGRKLSVKAVSQIGQMGNRGTSERSGQSIRSKQTLTKGSLKEYFRNNQEEIDSKYSRISKQSANPSFKFRTKENELDQMARLN